MATDTILKVTNFLASPSEANLRATPGGALVIGDWKAAAVARGWGWHVTVGDLSTPIVGGGNGDVIDQNQPELIASVPLGWTMRPLRTHIQCIVPLTATDLDETESLIAVDRTQISNVAAALATIESPLNMRTDIIAGCPVTVGSGCQTDVTNPTLGIELDRKVQVADEVGATPANQIWHTHDHLYEPKHPPFIVGPAALYVYFGGTVAVSGFIQFQFLAFPSSKITGLE